jgi:hypothetical protein
MYTDPSVSAKSIVGLASVAAVGAPPSPILPMELSILEDCTPVPATVDMIPSSEICFTLLR